MNTRLMLVPVLFLALPGVGTAQSGTVRYDQSTRIDIKLPPGMPMPERFPKASTRPMQLTFTAEAALWAAAPRPEAGRGEMEMRVVEGAAMAGARSVVMSSGGGMAGGPPRDVVAVGGEGGMMFFSSGPMGGSGRMDAVAGAYTNLADGSYIEVREFLGRTFRISEARPAFAWKLTGEQATFLGHPVFQARARQDSTSLEAWFTPDFPVSAGPGQYGGLPGLILTLAVDSNRIVYTATAIDTTAVGQLKAPAEGSKVTREEYEKIVKEKMDELAKQRRGRGN